MKIVSYGKTYDIKLRVDEYTNNGNLYIGADYFDQDFESYMPYCNLTVNLKDLLKGYAYVDTNNFPDAEDFIAKYGIGEPTGDEIFSGFCVYPLYKFDLEAIKEYQ